MTTTVFLGLLIGVLVVALLWLLGGPGRGDNVAESETGEAEEEVQDLDAFTSPDEAEEELPDWGPGAPKG